MGLKSNKTQSERLTNIFHFVQCNRVTEQQTKIRLHYMFLSLFHSVQSLLAVGCLTIFVKRNVERTWTSVNVRCIDDWVGRNLIKLKIENRLANTAMLTSISLQQKKRSSSNCLNSLKLPSISTQLKLTTIRLIIAKQTRQISICETNALRSARKINFRQKTFLLFHFSWYTKIVFWNMKLKRKNYKIYSIHILLVWRINNAKIHFIPLFIQRIFLYSSKKLSRQSKEDFLNYFLRRSEALLITSELFCGICVWLTSQTCIVSNGIVEIRGLALNLWKFHVILNCKYLE